MTKESIFRKNLFDQYKQKIIEINEHFDGCQYAEGNAPIDVYPWNCYEKQIFNLGMDAREELFYAVLTTMEKYDKKVT